MKIYRHFVLFFLILALAPAPAAEKQDIHGTLEQQLLEIDLKVLLRQYEQIQTQLVDVQLQLALLQSDGDPGEGDLKKQIARLQKREVVLSDQLQRTRTQIQILGERVKQSSK